MSFSTTSFLVKEDINKRMMPYSERCLLDFLRNFSVHSYPFLPPSRAISFILGSFGRYGGLHMIVSYCPKTLENISDFLNLIFFNPYIFSLQCFIASLFMSTPRTFLTLVFFIAVKHCIPEPQPISRVFP